MYIRSLMRDWRRKANVLACWVPSQVVVALILDIPVVTPKGDRDINIIGAQ